MNIKINNLTKTYADKTVLSINNFHINEGSFLGVIGPNGAGKSTLVSIIAGLDEATTGDIRYEDMPISPTISSKMTMVFQKPYLLRTSVYNNIAYPLRLRKISNRMIEVKVKEILEEMNIQNIANQNAWTLSGGESQKVALARSIIFEPSLLILDEPTANIDPASMLVMEKTIKSFHQKNKATIMIVTHNLQQAKRLCDDVVFMHQGKIIEHGKAEDIIMSSKNQLTRKFIEGEIIL
jgi:tungstate transport system ATP-binding protein